MVTHSRSYRARTSENGASTAPEDLPSPNRAASPSMKHNKTCVLIAQLRRMSSRSPPSGSAALPVNQAAIEPMLCSSWFIQPLLQSPHTPFRATPLTVVHRASPKSPSERRSGALRSIPNALARGRLTRCSRVILGTPRRPRSRKCIGRCSAAGSTSATSRVSVSLSEVYAVIAAPARRSPPVRAVLDESRPLTSLLCPSAGALSMVGPPNEQPRVHLRPAENRGEGAGAADLRALDLIWSGLC
ncbi:hypothetical protein EV645_3927 [Kribbella rubisoli]|uniref:Uncharacterized protein n=1 Tax=Kribbella rubisoli TaxID=3075929 RepID=A0A4Q7X0Q2_9ACTN|nr:hypothetical protein EV645_3927 [Kribbella rubisoli]